MDLESFLALEKRRLAEERQRLYEQAQQLNSLTAVSPATTTPLTSMTQNKVCTPQLEANTEDILLSKKTKDWINKQYNNTNKETDEDSAGKANPVRNARRKKNQVSWRRKVF